MISSSDQSNQNNSSDNFLQFLGNGNYNSLRLSLYKAFEGDSFEQNNRHALDNFFYKLNRDQQSLTLTSANNNSSDENNQPDNFLESFINWGQEQIDQAFSWRFKVAFATAIFLAIALTISLKLNFFAGIAIAGATTVFSAIAEGVAKRNISTYGHLSQHLAKKISGVSKKLISDYLSNPDLNDSAKQKLKKIKNLSYDKTSASFRGLSYFSGFSVSASKNITERLAPFLNFATSIIGFIIPVLPILVTFFSKLSSSYRQKTIKNQAQSLKDLFDILKDPQSWHQHVDINHQKNQFKENFKKHLEETDNHGKLPDQRGYHKLKSKAKDHILNPSKAVIAPVWISAKINRQISKFFKINHPDIAKASLKIQDAENLQHQIISLPITSLDRNHRVVSCQGNILNSNLNSLPGPDRLQVSEIASPERPPERPNNDESPAIIFSSAPLLPIFATEEMPDSSIKLGLGSPLSPPKQRRKKPSKKTQSAVI